jgi:hypothetical protein
MYGAVAHDNVNKVDNAYTANLPEFPRTIGQAKKDSL